jgi:hypothetical protein
MYIGFLANSNFLPGMIWWNTNVWIIFRKTKTYWNSQNYSWYMMIDSKYTTKEQFKTQQRQIFSVGK